MHHPSIVALFQHRPIRKVAGGQPLYEAGGTADALFLVTAGAFAVFRAAAGGRTLLGLVRPGEIVGEAGVLAGTARSATVVALRDSEAAILPAADFFRAARTRPDVMTEVARLLIRRAQSAGAPPRYQPPRVIGLVALCDRTRIADWAARLAAALRGQGHAVAVLDATAVDRSPDWWSRIEAGHDFVLCAAGAAEFAWRDVCRRQADRMLLLGRGDAPPPGDGHPDESGSSPVDALVDLVLIRSGAVPRGTTAWLDAVAVGRVHHLHEHDDCARLARRLTGTDVALVLSGGGARAFAHVGAVRALRRAGVPIDAVGGTSMGAIVAAGVAAGWDDRALEERMRAAFVTSNPLDDIALPLVAMTRGCKVDNRLAAQFGGWDIADLALPFFCVSADLGSGQPVVHRRGPLPIALRASISLPGVLPPVTIGDQVLVDGGTLLNLPTALMRACHDGTVIGVDVSRSQGLCAEDVARPRPLGRWLWSGAWRRGPPIVSILMRAATIAAEPELRAAREAADLYVMPKVDEIEIRNWRAFDRAVAAGEAAMTDALEGLTAPVEHLRRERQRAADVMPPLASHHRNRWWRAS